MAWRRVKLGSSGYGVAASQSDQQMTTLDVEFGI